MTLFRICAVAALVLCSNPALSAEVHAVASFSILADMVQEVGGDNVKVRSIVGPNADTHVYEPKPSDAVAVAGADIFFINGLGFEGWLDRLVQSTKYGGPVVVASQGVATHEMDEDGKVVTDPHAWQSLTNGLIYVQNIVDGLCTVDRGDCATYQANGQRYAARIAALDTQVMAEITSVPSAKRKVITTHDAFGYFGAEYGVTFLAPEGISTESEASAGDVARLITQIRNEGVTALFLENMSDTRLINQIAKDAGVTAGGELYADALSLPGEGAASYLEMMVHNVSLLVPAMKGN